MPRWIKHLAPYLVLGPVSGPLTAGIVRNLRGGAPFLATLYGILLVAWLLILPAEWAIVQNHLSIGSTHDSEITR